jgi:hypothetical protein
VEPPQDDGNSLNSPRNLALEATFINHNFSQQVLKTVTATLIIYWELNLGLVHPVAPVFNENQKSIAFVRNLSRLYCTQYNTALHVSAIQSSSGVSYIQKC